MTEFILQEQVHIDRKGVESTMTRLIETKTCCGEAEVRIHIHDQGRTWDYKKKRWVGDADFYTFNEVKWGMEWRDDDYSFGYDYPEPNFCMNCGERNKLTYLEPLPTVVERVEIVEKEVKVPAKTKIVKEEKVTWEETE